MVKNSTTLSLPVSTLAVIIVISDRFVRAAEQLSE